MVTLSKTGPASLLGPGRRHGPRGGPWIPGLLAALLAVLTACPAFAQDAFEEARLLLSQGRLDQALAKADEAASDPSRRPFARHLKGDIFFRLFRYDEALREFRAAFEASPAGSPLRESAASNAALVLCTLAASRREAGDPGKALELALEALSIEPDYAPALFAAGELRVFFGDYGAAAADFRRYLELEGDAGAGSVAAHHMLGRMAWDAWDLAEARKRIGKAAELDPGNELYRSDLAAIEGIAATVRRTAAAERALLALVLASLAGWAGLFAAGVFYLRRRPPDPEGRARV